MKITTQKTKKARYELAPIQSKEVKKRVNGSTKGATFERQVVKQLSLWWTDGVRDDIFWRTSGSGARATTRAKKGNTTANAYGDIMALDHDGVSLLKACCFELKCGYKPDILAMLDSSGKPSNITLNSFWQQAVTSAEQAGVKYPVVIFKRTSKAICLMISKDFYNYLISYCGKMPDHEIIVWANDKVFIRFSSFLAWATPKAIKALL